MKGILHVVIHLSASPPWHAEVLADCAGKGSFPGAGWVSQGRLGITKTGKAMRDIKGNTKATPGQDGGEKVIFQEADNMVWSCVCIVWSWHRKSLKGCQSERKPGRKELPFRKCVCDAFHSVSLICSKDFLF